MVRKFQLCLLIIIVLSLSGGKPIHSAQASQATETGGVTGVRGTADQHAVVNYTQIAADQAQNPPSFGELEVVPFMPYTGPEGIVNGPVSPDSWVEPDTSINAIMAPAPATSFAGLYDPIASGWGSIPPDTHGAVGPNHVMTTLNTQVGIMDRSGNLVAGSPVTLNSFWSAVGGGSGAFDPKLLYDPYGGRWIFVTCDDGGAATSGIMIGVSQTNDPTGSWNLYKIDADSTNTRWFDYPSIGFNKDWIVVNGNLFTMAGSFSTGQVYVFDKADLYGGGSGAYTLFTGNFFTLVPAITYDSSLDTMYLVRTYNSGIGYLAAARITGPVGSETFYNADNFAYYFNTGTAWSSGPSGGNDFAPQLNSAQLIQNNDHRIQNVIYRNGVLWVTHTVFFPSGGSPTRASVRWYQITPNTPGITAPTIVDSGLVDDPTGTYFYAFPSIAVNKVNDVLLGFSRFANNQYASGNYTYRDAYDDAGTMQSVNVLKAGEAPYYKIYSGSRNRWGDYSNSQVDPINDTDFWTIQEYAWTHDNGTNYDRWGTWWGRIQPTPQTVVYVDDNWASNVDGDSLGSGRIFGKNAFATIQNGVDTVAVGGTVIIAAGTYAENVTVNKNVTLIGPSDPGTAAANLNPASGTALAVSTGAVVVKGMNISTSDTAFNMTSGTLTLYANNVTSYSTAVIAIGGTLNARHNWWGESSRDPSASAPSGLDSTAWSYRLGSAVSSWADGAGSATLDAASLSSESSSTDTTVIVSFGRATNADEAPFGNGVIGNVNQTCSDFYDYFVEVGATGTWALNLPVDNVFSCNYTRDNDRLFTINDLSQCSPADNPQCWQQVTGVSHSGQIFTLTGLTSSALDGTHFVAGDTDGTDPTVLDLIQFNTSRKMPLGLGMIGLTITTVLVLIFLRTKRIKE